MPNGRADQLALDRLTARFNDRQLEERFLAERAARELRQVRWALILAVCLNLIFLVLDYLVITEGVGPALAIRFVWALPATGLGLALTYAPFFARHMELLTAIVALAATGFYAAINTVSNTPDVYLSGFIIILFFVNILIPLSFSASLRISVTITAIFAVAIPLTRQISLGSLLTIYSQFLATLVAGTFAVYLFNVFRRQEFLSSEKIADQSRQYFGLLTRILPHSIVARMEDGEEQIADNVQSAAVLFADIVAFTEMAARHPPDAVLRSLNALFKRFDELVGKHGLEKIKTIGDAYMVAGGVPETRDGHIRAIAELALDMHDAAAAHLGPDENPVQLRIGVHAGPLVAGVVGESRFGYDIWGDTVNVASRMQSHCDPGSTQVTEAIYNELRDAYTFDPTGKIAVKGKGKMEAWRLTGRKP